MDLVNKFTEDLNAALTDNLVLGPDANKAKQEITQNIKKFEAKESEDHKRNSPKDFLIDPDDMKEIYLLAKNKKLSANKIKTKIKEFLKNPDELKDFLKSILDSRGKKSENKEASVSGAGVGAFMSPMSGDFKNETPKKVETKEATGAGAGVGAYETPKAWAKSMDKKDWRGKSKTQIPGGKFVQVKKKCKRFPYCNQGDTKALNFFNEETTKKIINSMTSKYGLSENEIKQIILKEFRSNLNY
jgi:hypothetical protein